MPTIVGSVGDAVEDKWVVTVDGRRTELRKWLDTDDYVDAMEALGGRVIIEL